MTLKITDVHVKELATLFGPHVLVPWPDKDRQPGGLWVVAVTSSHYEGADTAYATSEQVAELMTDDDYDDRTPTQAAVSRVTDILNATPRSEAVASARQMPRPEGYSAWALAQATQPGEPAAIHGQLAAMEAEARAQGWRFLTVVGVVTDDPHDADLYQQVIRAHTEAAGDRPMRYYGNSSSLTMGIRGDDAQQRIEELRTRLEQMNPPSWPPGTHRWSIEGG